MGIAMTNEERFVASCESEGELGVRQKLNAGRYSERRAIWAAEWLELIQSGKSDITRAEEKNTASLKSAGSSRHLFAAGLVVVLFIAGAMVFVGLS